MSKLKLLVAPFIFLAGLLVLSGTAYASDDNEHTFTGTVMRLSANHENFSLVTEHSGTIPVVLNGDVILTDKDGSTRHLSDLANGLEVKVKGDFSTDAKTLTEISQVSFRTD